MPHNFHDFELNLEWTGNTGQGTANYRAYSRDHVIAAPGKAVPIAGSSAKTFRGDTTRYNPEELLIAALSGCHLLSYLHLCADAGITVVEYRDIASGRMELQPDGSGHFTEVSLHPDVLIREAARLEEAIELHHRAHQLCFIANSVNFPVHCVPNVKTA